MKKSFEKKVLGFEFKCKRYQ